MGISLYWTLFIILTADNEEASATGAEATRNTYNARVQQQPINESAGMCNS